MKSKLTFFIYLVIVTGCFGQVASKKVRFGLTAGLMGSQTVRSGSSSHLLFSGNGGISLEHYLRPNLSLSYQLMYARQGGMAPVTGAAGNDKVVTALDYINLPVMIRRQFNGTPLFVGAGAQVSYLVRSRNYFASTKEQAYAFPNTNSLDVGGLLSLGMRLGNHITTDVRYFIGGKSILLDYTSRDPVTGITTYNSAVKLYNRTYSLNLSYYF